MPTAECIWHNSRPFLPGRGADCAARAQFEVAHFEPALEAAMQENLDEIDRIAQEPAPATFENTIAAQERADRSTG